MNGDEFIDITYLESVMAVYHYKSFIEASSYLSISVSSVSKHVSAVERELNTKLFIRATKAKSVYLTDAGLRLMPAIEDVLSKYRFLERSAERLSNEHTEKLEISYLSLIGSMGEIEAISNFCTKHPNVNLIQTQSNSQEIVRMLNAGIIDGGFLFVECDGDCDGNYRKSKKIVEILENSDFGTICIYRSNKMTVGVPINHPLAKRDQVSLSDMLDDTFIINSANKDFHISESGQNFFKNKSPNVKLKFMEFTSRDIVFDTVAKGGGVITNIFRVNREHPGVKWLNLSDWNATTYGLFIYRRDVRSKAMQNFRKCVEEIAQKDNL